MTFKSDLASQYADKTKAGSDFTLQLYADLTHYWHLYTALGGLLAFIVLFGVCYEIVRRKREGGNMPLEEGRKLKHSY